MDWTTLIVNVPIVAGFIYFALTSQRSFLEALAAQEQRYQERNDALVEALQANTSAIVEQTKLLCSHDARVNEYIDRQNEIEAGRQKTRPKP